MFIWMLTTLLASPAILAHGLDSMSGPKEFYKYQTRFILTMFLEVLIYDRETDSLTSAQQ